jgi:hypothetical protein
VPASLQQAQAQLNTNQPMFFPPNQAMMYPWMQHMFMPMYDGVQPQQLQQPSGSKPTKLLVNVEVR